jgi:hypothetical protein
MPMTIDGNGSITGLVAGGLPDATVTQADLATGVTGNGPAFRAYRTSSNQSLTAATWTKVQLNAEDFDTASAFDSTTNYRFQPQVAGYYQINFGVQFLGTSIIAVAIYKNGVVYGIGTYFETALANSCSNTQDVVYLNGSTDYVEGYVLAISSGITVNGTIANQAQTRMSGFLARAA